MSVQIIVHRLLKLASVAAAAETWWSEQRADDVAYALHTGGHRLYSACNTTPSRSARGTGVCVAVRSDIPPHEGDGRVWCRPDGKAIAVALMLQQQPRYVVVAHYPHDDSERAVASQNAA